MKIDIQKIIDSARKDYAHKNNNKTLTELLCYEAMRSASNAIFDAKFPDDDRPEAKFTAECRVVVGKVEVGGWDEDFYEDASSFHWLMFEAESWVNENINMIMAFMEKQDLLVFIDQDSDDGELTGL